MLFTETSYAAFIFSPLRLNLSISGGACSVIFKFKHLQCRSSLLEVFYKKGDLKKFSKFAGNSCTGVSFYFKNGCHKPSRSHLVIPLKELLWESPFISCPLDSFPVVWNKLYK